MTFDDRESGVSDLLNSKIGLIRQENQLV